MPFFFFLDVADLVLSHAFRLNAYTLAERRFE